MSRVHVVGGVGSVLLCCFFGCGWLGDGTREARPPPPAASAAVCSEQSALGDDAQRDEGDDEGDGDRGGDPKKQCQPTAGGPFWLEEGETLAVKVFCATGREVKGDKFHFKDLPKGARYDKKTATLRWTPALDQAAVYELTILGEHKESGTVKVGVADNWRDPRNVPVVDPATYTEEYGLPVFHIQGASNINPDAQVPVTLIYRGHTYAAQAKKRGSSSLDFPKNSYTVKFPDTDLFNEPVFGDGFTGRHSLALINNFNDNSHLRGRLGFELWNTLSPSSVRVRTFSAVVFLDGAYHGLYLVADHVNEDLMGAHGYDADGNLYQADTGAANYRLTDQFGRPKKNLHVGYEKKEGKPKDGAPGAYDDLDAIVSFVATASDEEFLQQGPQRFDLRDYGNWWAFVTLLVSLDADVKNSFHYHDPKGGPWHYIPWDLDGTFGQTWKTQRLKPTAVLDAGADNELFRRLLAEPAFSVPLKAHLKAAIYTELVPALLQERVDELAREIGPSARRDEARWMQQYRSYPLWSFRTDFTTFDQEVAYIRQWIALRWSFVDTKVLADQ